MALKTNGEFIAPSTFHGYTSEKVSKIFESLYPCHAIPSEWQGGRVSLPTIPSLLKHINEDLLRLGLLACNYDFYVIDSTTKSPSRKRLRSQRTHRGKYDTAKVSIEHDSISVMFVCGHSGDGVDFVYSSAPTIGSNVMKDCNDSEYQCIGQHTTSCSVDEVRSKVTQKTLRAGKVYAIAGKTFMPEYPFAASSGSSSPVCVFRFVCLQGNAHQSNPFVLPCTSSALITKTVTTHQYGKSIATTQLRDIIKRFDNLSAKEKEDALQHYVDHSIGCYTAVPETGCDAAALEAEVKACPLHQGCQCHNDTTSMTLRQMADNMLIEKIDANTRDKRKHSELEATVQDMTRQLLHEKKKRQEAEASLYISGGPVWEGIVHEVKRLRKSRERMEMQVCLDTFEKARELRDRLSDPITLASPLGMDLNGQPCDVVFVRSICGNGTFFNSHSIAAWILRTGELSSHSPEYKLAPKTPGASSTIPLTAEQVLAAIKRHSFSIGMEFSVVHKSSAWVQQVALYANPLRCPRPSLRGRQRDNVLPDLEYWQQEKHNTTVVQGVETLETPWRKVCKEALSIFIDEKRAADFLGPNIIPVDAVALTWCTKTNFVREIAAPAWKTCEIVERVNANCSVD